MRSITGISASRYFFSSTTVCISAWPVFRDLANARFTREDLLDDAWNVLVGGYRIGSELNIEALRSRE